MNRSSTAFSVLLTIVAVAGCSGEKRAVAAQPRQKKEGDVSPRQSVVTTPLRPYRTVQVASPGRIAGTVDFDGAFPADSVIQLSPDQTGCGQTVIDHRIEHTGARVSGVAVWLTDIREGGPLPVDRRFELENADCVMNPRVQTVMIGGTLDILNADAAMHRNHVVDVATGEVQAIAPFNDNGQVIPFDRLLTKTAELEVTCELHPWSRAYVLVFDHPYYSVTDKSGNFSLDGVPPGNYQLRAWHPVLGLVDQAVTVGAGGQASVALKLPGEMSPSTPIDSSGKVGAH